MTGNAVCQGGKGAAQARRGGQNSELIIHVPRRAASAPGTSASEVTVATAAMATSEEKRVMAGGKWGGGGKDGGSAREAEWFAIMGIYLNMNMRTNRK